MHAEGRVGDALGQGEQPLHQRPRGLPLRTHRMPRTPSVQDPAELRRLARLLPERLRPRVRRCHFWGRPAFGGDERRPQRGLHREFLLATRGGVWQCRRSSNPLSMGDRLLMGTALQGLSPGLPPILHRPMGIPPALEMHRQFRGDLPRLGAIGGLLPRADPLMQPDAPTCWHPLVNAS